MGKIAMTPRKVRELVYGLECAGHLEMAEWLGGIADAMEHPVMLTSFEGTDHPRGPRIDLRMTMLGAKNLADSVERLRALENTVLVLVKFGDAS